MMHLTLLGTLEREETMTKKDYHFYLPPQPLPSYKCQIPRPLPLPESDDVDPSIRFFSLLREENKILWDPEFVGDHPPTPAAQHKVHYISFSDFFHAMDCAAYDFVQRAPPKDQARVELFLPCFSESGGFCFSKSNIWSALMVLPRLAPVLTRVRLFNNRMSHLSVKNTRAMVTRSMWETFQPKRGLPLHIVMVDDGIYSGTQYMELIQTMILPLGLSVHLHVICPFVTRHFLVRSGIPLIAFPWIEGKKRLKYVMRQMDKDDPNMKDLYHNVWRLVETFVDEEPDDDLIYRIRELPSFRNLDVMSQGLIEGYIEAIQLQSDPDMEAWKMTNSHLYTTYLMDNEMYLGETVTKFYFAHKLPDNLSTSVLPSDIQGTIQPPYRRHSWTLQGRPLPQDLLLKSKSMDLYPDLQERFKGSSS